MDEARVRDWFDEYRQAFTAPGRGQLDDLSGFLAYYAVPLMLATDDAARALTTAADVIGFVRELIEGMRAANYDHTRTIASEVTTLNKTSVLYRGEFARVRKDGEEIGRHGTTYLIIDGPPGLRIAAAALHTP